MNSPLSFSAPTLKDAACVRAIADVAQAETNDLSYTNMYLLQGKYQLQIAICNNCLFRYFGGSARWQGYAFPLCRPHQVDRCLRLLEEDADATGRPLSFCTLTEEQLSLLSDRYGSCFTWNNNRGDDDYLYRRHDLAELPGSLYHKKRNHIARFERLNPTWHFESITPGNACDAAAVSEGWLVGMEESPSLLHEAQAIRHALAHLPELEITGGLVYVGTHPVAMSLASPISPRVADIHYEKCLPEFRDAYPLINREMARLLSHEFINREEDLNVPGLRQAKLSYHPCKLIPRYSGTVC